MAHTIEENRTPCKCLTPVSEDIIRTCYEEKSKDTAELESEAQDISNYPIEILATSFRSECKESLQMLVDEAVTSEWREAIIRVFQTSVCAPSL